MKKGIIKIIFLMFFIAIPSCYSIIINEIMPNPIEGDEWIEFYNNESLPVNLTGWVIGDSSDNDTITADKEMPPFGFAVLSKSMKLNASREIMLSIDDLAIGNGLLNKGETLYLYFNSTLIDKVHYPEVEKGFSLSLINSSWLQTNPTPGYKNQDNRINSFADIKNSKSEIKIKGVLDLGSDKSAKFGQIIRVRLEIYKGNTNKNQVSVWIESKNGKKISKQSRANLREKFAKYDITLPIQIMPNCDNHFKDGKYIVIAKGLNEEDNKRVEIETKDCIIIGDKAGKEKENKKDKKDKSEENKKTKNAKESGKGKKAKPEAKALKKEIEKEKGKKGEEIKGFTAVKPIVVYESSREKTKMLIPLLLITLLAILNIILIWRR